MPEMATTIRFPTNTFSVERDFTFVGVNAQIGVVFGSLPPETPLVWVTFKNRGVFLNADISDSDGEPVLQIRDNVITVNKDNIYNLELLPGNKVPPDQVIVTNQAGEIALGLRWTGNLWEFNADFYHRGWHVVATPNGTVLNPPIALKARKRSADTAAH